MTHLRIELNNIQENVSSTVIEKLYLLAISGDLDASSNLAGNLHTTATYLEYIDGIRAKYPDLTISSDKQYIKFKDPEVERILKGLTVTQGQNTYVIGDGIGVPSNGDFTKFGILNYDWFRNNTTIKYFNELSKAVGCHEIYANAFNGCTNLQEIDLLNITDIGTNSFLSCGSLTSIGRTNNLYFVGTGAFEGTKLTEISLPSITTVYSLVFYNIPTLSIIDFGETLQSMNWQSVWECSNNLKMIFRGSTPPTIGGDDTRLYNKSYTIYIPDGCKEAYIQEPHFAANESKIHFISELSS